MTVSILTLGIIAHYTSLGEPQRKCYYNSTALPSSRIHSLSTMAPTTSAAAISTILTNSSTFYSPKNFTSSVLNTTVSKPMLASKGLRYLTLSALVLFVAAYSFSFGPGKLFHWNKWCVTDVIVENCGGFWCASRELKQRPGRSWRKLPLKNDLRCFKIYRSYSMSFNLSNICDFFSELNSKGCI